MSFSMSFSMLPDIKLMISVDEAVDILNKILPDWRSKWSQYVEDDDPQTDAYFIYQWLNCGRSSRYLTHDHLCSRTKRLVRRMMDMTARNDFRLRGDLIFTCRKEVTPPVFLIILD